MASRLPDLNLLEASRAMVWFTSFNAIARAKKWEDTEDKKEKTDNFIACCGLSALEKIISIVSPEKLENMNFATIEETIKKFLEPEKRLIVAERTKFYNAKQKNDEKITQFVARLRDLAKYCEFDQLKTAKSPEEEMIKIAMIAGIFKKEHQTKLLVKLQSEDMNTAELINFIHQLEQVAEFVNPTQQQMDDINFNSTSKTSIFQQQRNMNNEKFSQNGNLKVKCSVCGRNGHLARNCRKATVECFKCHKKGHYANECHFSANDKVDNRDFADCFTSEEEKKIGNLIEVHVMLNNVEHTLAMQEDTGASCTIISTTMWKSLGSPKLQKFKGKSLKSYDGTSLTIIGVLPLLIKYRKRYDICEVRVVRANKSFGLLGRDMLPSQLDELCNATSQDDEPALGNIRYAKARLTISENAKPIFCNAREVPLPLKQKVEEELQKMIDMGIISPVPAGGSEWASPLVCVRKSDNTLRLCCDYKVTINKYLLNDQYNAPDMETIFSKLEGAKNFAKFDLKSAFWQVELDESSKKLTTINTSKGLFWFNRLPFGVKTASCIFQRIIENICKGLEGILAYQDDILVYAKDASELKIRSEALLKRLNKRNVQINWSKSIRSLESVTFLGHTVSAEGIEPDKKLVNKILNISPPRCRKDVERFLGLANFYHTKMSNFAKICEPLNKLRRQGMPFVWRNEQQNAFVNLKEALCSRQVVQPYSLNKELTLECDASETSIGSVLSQEGAPVMFLSRTLTKNERNYAVIEKEALAIVWSVKRAEKFLLGRHFNIKTDHNSLEYIFGEHKCLPKHTSARIQRWAVTMTNYDYTIRYVRGKEIPHVDAMSRLNFTIEDITNINSLEEDIFWNDECGVTWMEIAQETINDRLLRGVKHRIKENLWENCAPAEKQYQKNRAALSIENNVIILGTRPVIPRTLQDKIMKTAHQAHFGMTTTKNVLRQSVWWPGIDRSVKEFV